MNKTKRSALLVSALSLCLFAGCRAPSGGQSGSGTNSNSGSFTENMLDTATLSKIETALEPVVSGATRRALKNSPHHSAEIASYMRSVGGVFCLMQSSGQFEPAFLVDLADKIGAPQLSDDMVIDIKNAAIAIYKIAWGDRFHADVPADQWPGLVAKLICQSIDQGLKDAGQPGIQ
jgi:hypothetical protein